MRRGERQRGGWESEEESKNGGGSRELEVVPLGWWTPGDRSVLTVQVQTSKGLPDPPVHVCGLLGGSTHLLIPSQKLG